MAVRVPTEWEPEFEDGERLVFAAGPVTGEWDSVMAELREAFRLSQVAAQEGWPITYIVHNDDLLGRRGAGGAMVATGLLSAARTAALELAKSGVSESGVSKSGVSKSGVSKSGASKSGAPVNVLAIEDDTAIGVIARWATLVSEAGGPTGELIHLGAGHIGKALV